MNKTIYIRDEDVAVWDQAKELAGDKLSPVIVAGLKRFVAEKEAETKGFQRIEQRFYDADAYNLPKAKAFFGKWIISPEVPFVMQEDNYETYKYAVAVTARGNIVVYSWIEGIDETKYHKQFVVFPSFEAAAADPRVNEAVRKAKIQFGVPIEELDI